MDKEFIQNVHDANATVKEAKEKLLQAVKNYFESNPEHTIEVTLSSKAPSFYDVISAYPETFNITFKEGDVNINVKFEVYYYDAAFKYNVGCVITSSLELPEISIMDSNPYIKKLITINAFYQGKLDRKISLHFEKDEPTAKFKVM